MKLNKENFLKTEVGNNLKECITAWDHWINESRRYAYVDMTNREYRAAKEGAAWCQAQWEVYKMVLLQFFGIEYNFTRTDEYFGLVTEDEKNWLFKVERAA